MESTWDIVYHAMITQNVSSIVSQNSAHPWRPVWYFLGKTSWNPWNYWFSLFLLLYVTVYTCFRVLVTQNCSSFMVGKCTVHGPPVLLVLCSWLTLGQSRSPGWGSQMAYAFSPQTSGVGMPGKQSAPAHLVSTLALALDYELLRGWG